VEAWPGICVLAQLGDQRTTAPDTSAFHSFSRLAIAEFRPKFPA